MNTYKKNIDTPVLLLIFNRPDTALQVVQAIKKVKPTKLYIAADGPRKNKAEDRALCQETRQQVLSSVDWDCEVHTLLRDENLGSGLGVVSAINWFFEKEEMGIILEDDCLPNESFFVFCQQLLHHYKDDERIMHISGFNGQAGAQRGSSSYYFSYNPSVWGWASWRRAWKHNSFHVKNIDASLKRQIISTTFYEMNKVGERWFKDFERCLKSGSAWDYQWCFSIWKQHGLAITTNQPLVKNIGFDGRGTHTVKKPDDYLLNMELKEIGENITHPIVLIPNKEADVFSFRNQHYPKFTKRVKLKLQSVLNL